MLAGSEHYVACHFPLIEAAEVQVGPPIRLADGRTAAADAPTGSVSPNGKEWAKSSPGEGGWRSALGRMWRETSVAVKVAVLAALLPFVIHLSSTSKSGANGVVTSCTHHDYAALGGGIVAIVASIAAVATLRKAKWVPVEVAGVAIAVVIGVVQILLGLGSVGGPC